MVLLLSAMGYAIGNNQNAIMDQDPILRHVVSFKFKAETPEAKLHEIIEAFKALPQKIKEIKSFEWGTNNSPEGLNKEMTHCFLLTFESEQDRDIYLPHPDHKAFGALAGPYIEDVFVIDYWVN